ncbi:MAG: hypothetical protein ABF477_07380 [Leuconostoc pseudomesenteroides]
MSKENPEHRKEIKKSMTIETRSMSKTNTDEDPESHLSPFEKINQSKDKK